MTHYIALIHKDADSGYGDSFPDVPGVTAVADTLDEALHEAGIALAFAFEDWSGTRPTPHTLDELPTGISSTGLATRSSPRLRLQWRYPTRHRPKATHYLPSPGRR
jgi:predicted RNase H-like HicB family nuclease